MPVIRPANLEKFLRSSQHLIFLPAVLSALCLAASPASGAILLVTDGSFVNASVTTPGSQTIPVNASLLADVLIVGVSNEMGPTGTITASYDGNPMSMIAGNGRHSSIFFLDLTQTSYVGGTADLFLDWSYENGGSLGVSWVSLWDASNLPGTSIGVVSTATSTNSLSVALVTDRNETFNFVNFNSGGTGGTVTVNTPLQQIYANTNIGSARGAAGWESNVAAGTNTYSWSVNNDPRRIDAVALAVIPEPSTLLMTGLSGLELIIACRWLRDRHLRS